MTTLKIKIKEQLIKFLPEEGIDQVVDLISKHKVKFKVSKPRLTKLGDYRSPNTDGYHRITVNGNLNKYAFFLTSIHEFAHLENQLVHGNRVSAHGKEWKSIFSILLKEGKVDVWFPDDIKKSITRYIKNPKASSCGDHDLFQALRKYDKRQSSPLLKELEHGAHFILQDRVFQKGEMLRKRVKCKEIHSGKLYLVNAIAEVVLISKEK